MEPSQEQNSPGSDGELLALKRRKAQLLQQKLNAIKNYGLAFYKPHAKQDAFHRAGATFKRRMFRAGNRTGKSTAGCAEDCAWVVGERAWMRTDDPDRRAGIPQHPVKLLTLTTDWDKVDEIFTSQRGEGGKVWKMLPTNFVKSSKRNHSGAIDTIEGHNGSLWKFDTVKSFMANPMGSESSDWDAVHCDEPLPEDMWKATSRGLIDRGGSAWFTLTPLREPWINDYFFPEDTGQGQTRSGVWAISASIYDNPYLPLEAIKEFEQSLNEDEKQCRIHGIPLHLAGLIYKQFWWDKHVLQKPPAGWDSYLNPPQDWSIYYNIDPHPQTPHAVLFLAVGPLGTRIYFHDIFQHCSVAELSRQIQTVVKDRNVIAVRIDPCAFINDPITETNMAFEFWQHGVPCEKATKALAQGILRVQDELGKDPTAIYFAPTCRRTLWEMQRYCWDERENKPVDKDDHMMENLYRMELSEPSFVDWAKSSKPVEDIEILRPEFELENLEFK